MRCAALGAVLCLLLCSGEAKVLFDFRASQPVAPRTSDEAERRVISAVFPRYLTSEDNCGLDLPATDAGLAEARETGQIVPELISQESGSFTRPAVRQSVYLIKVGECGATAASYFGTYRLAFFQNDHLIAAAQSPGGDAIDAVADIDGSGIQGILISGCGFGQGVVDCSATLLSAAGGSVKPIREFPDVYQDGCESGQFGIRASVLRYTAGKPPHFFEEQYEASCPPAGQKAQFRPAASAR